MKIKDYKRTLWGKVVRLKSEQFGVHTFLISKFPRKYYEDNHIFIDLVNEWANTLYYSSVKNDEILEMWDNINDWKNNIVSLDTTTKGENEK